MVDLIHLRAMERLVERFVCPTCGPAARPQICVFCLKVLCAGGCSHHVACTCILAQSEMAAALRDVVTWRESPEGPTVLFAGGAAMMNRVRRAIDYYEQAQRGSAPPVVPT